ncbi:hypothetical protein BDY24DRAFT_445028 [Mrakia frigida]|uniref:uncharacterized protein n=1 Tax=Mrakia frigida TaxID=29902 RepID=UPI003FCC0DD6
MGNSRNRSRKLKNGNLRGRKPKSRLVHSCRPHQPSPSPPPSSSSPPASPPSPPSPSSSSSSSSSSTFHDSRQLRTRLPAPPPSIAIVPPPLPPFEPAYVFKRIEPDKFKSVPNAVREEDDASSPSQSSVPAAPSSRLASRRESSRRNQQEPSKRRRIDSPPRRNAVASSSRVTLDHHPRSHRPSLPSSSRAFTSTSKPPHHPSRSSLPDSLRQPTQDQPRRSTSPLTSASPSPAPESVPPPPPPIPTLFSRLPSPEIQNLEPPSFLTLGARPSTASPSSNWCYFCGSNQQPQPTFATLALAAKSLDDDGEVVRVPGRLACWTCEKVYTTRVVHGKRLAEGVKEMGELERLAWVTGELVKKGMKEREFRVYG